MELSPASGAAAEARSWPEMFPALEPSDSPLPPDDLEAAVPVSGAVAGGMLDRILLESVCQQQSWVRVYGKGAGPRSPPRTLLFPLQKSKSSSPPRATFVAAAGAKLSLPRAKCIRLLPLQNSAS